MDVRKVGVWAATIFVAAVIFMTGASKILQPAGWQERFTTQWSLPAGLVIITGWAEVLGAALILWPRTAVYGGAIVAIVMIGATGAHFVAGELANLPVTSLLGGMAGFVAWFRCSCNKAG
jgi:uncharacterized membrane protein YphA (DoxX/SURF4 family)